MAFNTYSFTFDGLSCEEYGLMVYDFDGPGDGPGSFASTVTIQEDRIARRSTPLHYGVTTHTPLEFSLTFGPLPEDMDRGRYLDRWDLENIGSWLTGHDGYRWLHLEQPDLEYARFRCIITDLRYDTAGLLPWSLTAKVRCDGPYAYGFPEEYTYTVSGAREGYLFNRSTVNGCYYPELTLTLPGGGDFSIVNRSDGDRTFALTGVTGQNVVLRVDNASQVITCNQDLDRYPNLADFRFFRLVRGDNQLQFHGQGTVTIRCQFPMNVGG